MTMANLAAIRDRFVDNYVTMGYAKSDPKALYDYQKRIIEAGHGTAYNYWVMMQGNQGEFQSWFGVNEEAWENFIAWFTINRIPLGIDNAFYRR